MNKAQLISRRGDQSGTGNKFAVFYIRKPEHPLLKFAWLYKKQRERNREHRIREIFRWNRGWVIAKGAGGAMWWEYYAAITGRVMSAKMHLTVYNAHW